MEWLEGKDRARLLLHSVDSRIKSAVAIPAFSCPNCGLKTSVFGASKFAAIVFGRARCDHCGQEFLIVNDVAVTEEEYRKESKIQ
jgi:transcription elongation factor Elf1